MGRVTAPMSFRLVLQPAMAILFAVRDGLKDVREGRPPYFFSVFTDPSHRRYLLGEGFKAVARVLGFAVLMDAVYQFKVFRWVYPGEALLVALILAFVPYLLLRGPVNRIARLWRSGNTPAGRDSRRA